MTLKILGGKFGGRLLKSVKTDKTRPTTSLVRKALFDILQPAIQDAVFLDLFAGTGAIGIEALSRGASLVIFIDSDKQAIQCIQQNIALLGLSQSARILQGDAVEVLKKQTLEFDIIYVDPPYHNRSIYLTLIQLFDQSSLLKPGGVLFMETKAPSPLDGVPLKTLKALPPRKYGDSLLCQYSKPTLHTYA